MSSSHISSVSSADNALFIQVYDNEYNRLHESSYLTCLMLLPLLLLHMLQIDGHIPM